MSHEPDLVAARIRRLSCSKVLQLSPAPVRGTPRANSLHCRQPHPAKVHGLDARSEGHSSPLAWLHACFNPFSTFSGSVLLQLQSACSSHQPQKAAENQR